MEQNNILLEDLQGYGATPIFEAEIMTSMKERFIVSVYKKENDADRQFINTHRKQIKAFFDAGYNHVGLGDFGSCTNDNSVKRNTVMLKVAQTMDEPHTIVAMSIYSANPSGVKCVGITRLFTDDERLTRMGRAAVKYMIKDDICHAAEFRWCECSGAVKYQFEKLGGDVIKIPNIYLPMIFNETQMEKISLIPGEEYEYMRYIKAIGKAEKKCIFGFPNKKVLDDYLKKRNKWLDDFVYELNKDVVFEHMFTHVPYDIKNNIQVLRYFYSFSSDDGTFEITEHEMEVLIDKIDVVQDFLNNRSGLLTNNVRDNIADYLDQAMEDANSFAILKPYEIGEDFILEQDRYVDFNDPEYYQA